MPPFTTPSLQAQDPDFARRVRASFDRQTIMGLIGARLTRVEPGEVEIELPFREDLCQQHGFFHAGVTSTIADSAGGYAGFSLFPTDASVLTVEFKMNLLAPADGDLLRRLFEAAGVPSGEATTLADRVLDYRDRDELRHPSGAEDRDYAAAGAPFGAADRAFVNVEELRRVLGVTDPVYRAVQGSLTVAGSGSRPDLASAPPLVKTALGVAAPEAPEATLPPAASTGTYRLRALARLPGGGIFLREAVVELRAGSSAPPVVLDWRHLWQLPPEFSISTAGADGSLPR